VGRGACILVALVLVLGGGLRPARADRGLDVERWLTRPGVKLLAVEFYATWCKPCMEAVPKWRALHEKYRGQGLRLVVVSAQDPNGGCVNPGWAPDDIVCDDEGHLMQRWGAQRLPAAFLWSWQGELLAQRASVEDVELQIEAWLRGAQRVEVAVAGLDRAARVRASDLEAGLRAELQKSGKLEVPASREERRALNTLIRRSMAASADDSLSCEIGQQITANSLLKASVRSVGGRLRLFLSLLSAERGCLVASAAVDWSHSGSETSIAEAVAELFSRMQTDVQRPAHVVGRTAPPAPPAVGPVPGFEPAREGSALVRFTSDPPGAVVFLDGRLLCQDTSKGCSKLVSLGGRRVRMEMERHLPREERVEIKGEAEVRWPLVPNTGRLAIATEPLGLSVTVDGHLVGAGPIAVEVAPGLHRVVGVGPCHTDDGRDVTVEHEREVQVVLRPAPLQAGLRVVPEDGAGNVVKAKLEVDGRDLGWAPGTFSVSACAKTATLRHLELGRVEVPLELKAGGTREVKAVFAAGRAGGVEAGIEDLGWVFSLPAKVDMMRAEVTVRQFGACVEAGACQPARAQGDTCNTRVRGRETHPMNCVDWMSADQFCRAVGGRLPTEEEWQAEATDGGTRVYPWGAGKPSCDRAIMSGSGPARSGPEVEGRRPLGVEAGGPTGPGCSRRSTWAVCSRPEGRSASGLCDMAGNVWEWTLGAGPGGERVVRGGSWASMRPTDLMAGRRRLVSPAMRHDAFGFRCVRDASP
jgi:sulfatase modifying factor 1